ncbi:MAG: hypothetical protein HQM09_09485 [Candidatus Riflebacteria bacterium]|nr:hypothetical protein [Candidatus Riflebacteria bacterium]
MRYPFAWSEYQADRFFPDISRRTGPHENRQLRVPLDIRFSGDKKKSLILEIEIPDDVARSLGLLAMSEDGQVGEAGSFKALKGRPTQFREGALSEVHTYSDSGKGEFLRRIREIDNILFGHIEQPLLWRERADLSLKLDAKLSATIGRMTAGILDADQKSFLAAAHAYAKLFPEFAALSRDDVNIASKGELLATIRGNKLEAEVHYGLLLAFAERFEDPDIFRQAVDSMRTGYAAERRVFHNFSEHDGAGVAELGSAGKLSLMGLKDLARIQVNVNRFLQLAGCGPAVWLLPIVKAQFHLLLKTHLSENIAQRLVPYQWPRDKSHSPEISHDVVKQRILGIELGAVLTSTKMEISHDLQKQKLVDLHAWPDLPSRNSRSESTRRWYSLLTMDRMKDSSLQDFFTGSLYRPALTFPRVAPSGDGELERIPWLAALSTSELPETSDGKPVARAIFNRYVDGHSDWGEYFQLCMNARDGVAGLARSQRVLLFLVADYGAMADFRRYILPPDFEHGQTQQWDIHLLTLYCDIYRLCMSYHIPINDQRLFEMLLAHIPRPPNRWADFRGSAEWVTMCLFLSSSPKRRFQLDELLNRALLWLGHIGTTADETMMDEILTILSFLEIGVLADLVPEKLEQHQFRERRRSLWLEHARALSGGGANAFPRWLAACRSGALNSSPKGRN